MSASRGCYSIPFRAIKRAIMQCDDFAVFFSSKKLLFLRSHAEWLLVVVVAVAVSRVITVPLSARFAVARSGTASPCPAVRPPAATPVGTTPRQHRRAETAGCQSQLVPPRHCPPTPSSLPIRHALTKSVMQSGNLPPVQLPTH